MGQERSPSTLSAFVIPKDRSCQYSADSAMNGGQVASGTEQHPAKDSRAGWASKNSKESSSEDSSDDEWSTPQGSDAESIDTGAELDFKFLCILDYDDTLFPTSAVNMNNLDAVDRANLKRVEKHAVDVLRAASTLGTVIIVTNATERWMHQTLREMPRLCRKIDKEEIDVIHARRVYARGLQAARNSNAFDWKTHTIRKEVIKFLDKIGEMKPDPGDFRVLCVGDGDAEIEAARKLKDDIDKNCLRILKLAEEPDVSTMCRQLYNLARQMEQFVNEGGFQEKHLVIYSD